MIKQLEEKQLGLQNLINDLISENQTMALKQVKKLEQLESNIEHKIKMSIPQAATKDTNETTDITQLQKVESELRASIDNVNEKMIKDINRLDRKIDE